MKTFSLLCFLLSTLLLSTAHSQHFIGKSIEEIKEEMQQKEKDFYFSKEVNTEKYHFLKYEDADETKTKLFILDEEGKCKYTKLMCDYSLLKTFMDSLNQNYEYQKDMTWIDYAEETGDELVIELEKREWFFTVRTGPLKK